MNTLSPDSAIEKISQRVTEFSIEIGQCFDQSDWDKLAEVLALRHRYFEETLAFDYAENARKALISLIENVLTEDSKSLSTIQEQKKKKLLELHLLLENGVRAIKAYKSKI